MKTRVGIVGITGYSGLELAEIALAHPAMHCVAIAGSESSSGKALGDIHPKLRGLSDLVSIPPDAERLSAAGVETAFLCTPNETSHELAPRLLDCGIRVIDLSGSFRLASTAYYTAWYGFAHSRQDLLDEAVYGLSEWKSRELVGARLVANPGCYPTSVLLALLPLARAGLLRAGSTIVCDSKSGVTGAGRSLRADLLFGEVDENFRAYSPLSHRHVPEMCEQLEWNLENFTFVPHLLPVSRGIHSTIYIELDRSASVHDLENEYTRCYRMSPFVRSTFSRLPELKDVVRTNYCDIGWQLTGGGRRAILFSAIDNLVKGAAGQAVQNFNLVHGLDQRCGLPGGNSIEDNR